MQSSITATRGRVNLSTLFGAAWIFDCFICQDLNTFMCKLDGGAA